MKQHLIPIMGLFILATLLLNCACQNQQKYTPEPIIHTPEQQPPPIEIERSFLNISPGPKDPLEEWTPYFHCSHKIGSTVRPGDTIKLGYTKGFTGIMCEITMKRYGGFKIKIAENGSFAPPSLTNRHLKICWGEDNCFIAEKNKDNTWTIKSLPSFGK